VPAASALSNRSLHSIYNYARRPILRTGLRPVQLFLVFYIILVHIFYYIFWFASAQLQRPLLSVDVSVCGSVILSVCPHFQNASSPAVLVGIS